MSRSVNNRQKGPPSGLLAGEGKASPSRFGSRQTPCLDPGGDIGTTSLPT